MIRAESIVKGGLMLGCFAWPLLLGFFAPGHWGPAVGGVVAVTIAFALFDPEQNAKLKAFHRRFDDQETADKAVFSALAVSIPLMIATNLLIFAIGVAARLGWDTLT